MGRRDSSLCVAVRGATLRMEKLPPGPLGTCPPQLRETGLRTCQWIDEVGARLGVTCGRAPPGTHQRQAYTRQEAEDASPGVCPVPPVALLCI